MEVSTPLGDPDWESSEKSGLMVDQKTGDDLLDTADEDQEEADLTAETQGVSWRGYPQESPGNFQLPGVSWPRIPDVR